MKLQKSFARGGRNLFRKVAQGKVSISASEKNIGIVDQWLFNRGGHLQELENVAFLPFASEY